MTAEEQFLNNQSIVRVDISMSGIKYNYTQACQLLREYAAQQVKQVTEERDKAVELLRRADGILNYSGHDIHFGSPFAQWVKDFLNSLNAAKEGGE